MTYTARKVVIDRLDDRGDREYIRVERHTEAGRFFVEDFPTVDAFLSAALPHAEVEILG